MIDLHPVVPEDFDAFWQEVADEARAVPLDFQRAATREVELDGFSIDLIRFRSVQGLALEGWFAREPDVRRQPAFLWIPPYGRESLLPNVYGTRPGFASMSLNLHGLGAFHQEKYTPARGYFAEGAASPETWVFRRLIQHCLVAMRVLQAQLEVHEERLGVMGMSQGAGMAIWTGAHSPLVKAVVADMPFLGGIDASLRAHVYRYPLKELSDFRESQPLGEQIVGHTVSYFDTITQASRCRVPTLVSYGTKDPSVRPPNATAIYEALPGEKRLVEYDWGHDWHPEMLKNNADWLRKYV